ncbi:putative transcription factor [Gregarina niphandrodes]|uniref:Transcription factor n=1 Tax=Gregarina niphandrodes TaxID=110365 RepID=A0A023AZW4_GRENI|nr:putative transcription factor [Gregarina niphandrodes]EZG43845.1 putative transcription factor [Gregarina niphandrodes]|eukprot:XP_011132966.1 putative transcription factor [Gregarina niphandrodes]
MPKRRGRAEEDEEDEEYVPPAAGRKKKRGGVGSFLEFEAAEDDAEAEEELDEEDDGGFLDDSGEAAEAAEMDLSHRRRLEEEMGGESAGRGRAGNLYYNTVGALERRYADGDAEGGRDAEYGDGYLSDDYLDDSGAELQKMLPGAWKLWKVRTVRPGVEREACVAVLRKFASERSRGAFMIASAFASDSVKGSIYVEAPSQNAIQKHLGDIRQLLTSGPNVKRVPVKEMADVFQMDARREELPRLGEWVRFQRGPYAGDLALVSALDENAGSVVVRVIPRIDLSKELAREAAAAEGAPAPAVRERAPPRRITLADLESYQFETERPNYFTECVKFRNYLLEERTGFLLRTVKPQGLLRGAAVKPTADELAKFQEPGVDLSTLVGVPVSSAVSAGTEEAFVVGQPVSVVSGELAGLSGTVVGRDVGGELKISTGGSEVVSVQVEHCRKDFALGDSVRVVGGPYAGETGLVTKLDGHSVHVLSTESHRQIAVDIAQLTVAAQEVRSAVGLTRLDGYAVGDFVLIAGSAQAGVITKISKARRLDVLTKDGVEQLELSQLSGKHHVRAAKEQDANNNEFGVGSAVEILEGPQSGSVGNVKYIWKDTAFVQVPTGLVAVSCASVRREQHAEQPTATTGNHSAQSSRPRGQIGFRTQFAIMGTQVKLISGPHKGLQGELRGIQGHEAVVLVSAVGAEVRVPRHAVQLINEAGEAAKFFRRRGGFNSRG